MHGGEHVLEVKSRSDTVLKPMHERRCGILGDLRGDVRGISSAPFVKDASQQSEAFRIQGGIRWKGFNMHLGFLFLDRLISRQKVNLAFS